MKGLILFFSFVMAILVYPNENTTNRSASTSNNDSLLNQEFLDKVAGKTAQGKMGIMTVKYSWSENGREAKMMMGKKADFVKAVSSTRGIYKIGDSLAGVEIPNGTEVGKIGFFYSSMSNPPKTEDEVFLSKKPLSFKFD